MSELGDLIVAQLPRTLNETNFARLGTRYVGKVRDNYSDGTRRAIVVTDRLSAFDVVLGTIPFKGQVLNQMASYWFEHAKHIAPNHVMAVPDPNVTIAIECEPLPVEMVMRAYLTGVTSTSIWHHYEKGERTFCGHALPNGLKKNEPLAKAILTPSTKAAHGGHDESVSRAQLLARGIIDEATFDQIAKMSEQLFAFGQAEAQKKGLILVDTKYELGRTPDGRIIFIDEIHTPDSSRYWFGSDYEARMSSGQEPRSLDKEYVRKHYAQLGYLGEGPPPPMPDDVRVEAARRYIEAFELISGETFVPNTQEPLARIARNLEPFEQTQS